MVKKQVHNIKPRQKHSRRQAYHFQGLQSRNSLVTGNIAGFQTRWLHSRPRRTLETLSESCERDPEITFTCAHPLKFIKLWNFVVRFNSRRGIEPFFRFLHLMNWMWKASKKNSQDYIFNLSVFFVFYICAFPQVVSNRETQETLLCIAFVFEVSTSEHGAQYHVYRLVND